MKPQPLVFYDYARCVHVKRWHTVATVHQQSVAEHQWLVTAIALELNKLIVGEEPPVTLILEAMFHDAPEVRLGDPPTPAKRHFPAYNTEAKLLMEDTPYAAPGSGSFTDSDRWRMIKMADVIADAWWSDENCIGIHGRIVAKGASAAMALRVVQYSDETGRDWFEPVNKVLQALGMPYLSQSLRETPP